MTKLVETTFARLEKHLQERNVAFISACRANNTPEQNNKATEALEADIRERGYGFIKVKGGYVEKHNGQDVPVEEKSFIVIDRNKPDTPYIVHNNRNFLRDMLLFTREYNQEAVLVKLQGEKAGYYLPDGTLKRTFNNISKEDIEEYYTRLRNTKFTFTEAEENQEAEEYNYNMQSYSTKILGCMRLDEFKRKYPDLFEKYPAD